MSDEATTNGENKLDAATAKCVAGFESFSNSKCGNLILDFVMFKRNIVPYTLQILYVLFVVLAWVAGIAGIFDKGPIGDFAPSYGLSLVVSLLVIVFAPFILHYLLEIVKFLWGFVLHVYEKVLIPIWLTLVVRFFANVAPQILPFMYERFMKVVDIGIDKLAPALDAAIDGAVAIAMAIAGVFKGILWLPKTLCKRLGRWANKPETEEAK